MDRFELSHKKQNTILKTADRNHFNGPLSATQKWMNNETVKAKLKLTVTFTMTDRGYHHGYKPRMIRRLDILLVHDYALENSSQRDYLVVRVFMKTGLRTTELCTLKIEHLDFDTYHFKVLDSKKHRFCPYPLALDVKTVELIRELIGNRVEGFVFRQSQSWKKVRADAPLTKQTVWTIIHNIGVALGIEGLTPRSFRQWFAAEWYYHADEEKRDLPELQRYLRHERPGTTLDYVNAMVFQEDVDAAYRRRMDEVAGRFVEGCHFKQKEVVESEW